MGPVDHASCLLSGVAFDSKPVLLKPLGFYWTCQLTLIGVHSHFLVNIHFVP